MSAGAFAMFKLAFLGLVAEHGAMPDTKTWFYIFFSIWFVIMMVPDVLLLTNKKLKFRFAWVALLTAGVIGPAIYMVIISR